MLISTSAFLFFVPEAQRNLAGGEAKRNHRKSPPKSWRPGRDAGQKMLVRRSCQSANLHYTSSLRFHRRLISVALPARKLINQIFLLISSQ